MPPLVWVLLAAAGTFALTMGARQSMGLFVNTLNTHTGVGLAAVSLAFAFGQLWWGLTQPVAGIVADRIGAGRVLIVGLLLVALGTALVPFMSSTAGLIFAIGVLAAGGAGMAGPAVLMAATTRLVPPERRGAGERHRQRRRLVRPVHLRAGGAGHHRRRGLGQRAVQPGGVHAAGAARRVGVAHAAARERSAAPATPAAPAAPRESVRAVLARAWALPSYRWLCAGFFVCGFHVAFIATHLPGVVASCQLPPEVGAWSLAVIGLFNIVGSLTVGWAIGYQGGRWRMKSLLSLIYAARALAVLVFVFAPKTSTTMLIFAAVIGFTYLSTVPPTAGLVARFFGPAHMAMLFGVVMLSHQIGGFLGAYLGGKSVEWTGNYDWMWWADIVLAVGAALAHLPIDEKKKPALAAQPA